LQQKSFSVTLVEHPLPPIGFAPYKLKPMNATTTTTENSQTSAVPTAKTAPVQEIFSSFQGEGPWVGCRQLFVRFAHCHLKCAYCDTPMNSPDGLCHIETPAGSGHKTQLPNPLTPEALLEQIRPFLTTTPHLGISFTGGEPLLYHAFLKPVFESLQVEFGATHPHLIYLETSGTQPEFLLPLLPFINIVAMDIKLPSATGEPEQFKETQAFYHSVLKWNQTHPEQPPITVFAKLIFNDQINTEELQAVKEILSDRDVPILLQPETSLTDKRVQVSIPTMFRVYDALSESHSNVRLIPQTHKMLNVL
jgi:7-carboxy-7-deazaguanine synthase